MCSHLSRPLCSSKTLITASTERTYAEIYEICVCVHSAHTHFCVMELSACFKVKVVDPMTPDWEYSIGNIR